MVTGLQSAVWSDSCGLRRGTCAPVRGGAGDPREGENTRPGPPEDLTAIRDAEIGERIERRLRCWRCWRLPTLLVSCECAEDWRGGHLAAHGPWDRSTACECRGLQAGPRRRSDGVALVRALTGAEVLP